MDSTVNVYETISRVCSLSDPCDDEQVLDIILSRGESTGNKFADFANITKEWTEKEWKSVLREFYVSFQKAALCRLSFEQNNPGRKEGPLIEAQKNITQYKKAPDQYYLHLINYETDKPTEGTPCSDPTRVLCAVYAAVSLGENYGSICYPPKEFVEQVVADGTTREDFYATCREAMGKPESFERMICKVAETNKALVKQMRAAYKELIKKDVSEEINKTVSKANQAREKATVMAEKVVRKAKKTTKGYSLKFGTVTLLSVLSLVINIVVVSTRASAIISALLVASVSIIPIIGVVIALILILRGGSMHRITLYILCAICAICTLYSACLLIGLLIKAVMAKITGVSSIMRFLK